MGVILRNIMHEAKKHTVRTLDFSMRTKTLGNGKLGMSEE